MRLKNTQRIYRLSTKARSKGVPTPSINTEGDKTLSIVTTKRSALTKAVTLFALAGLSVIVQPAAATFAAPDATGDTPATAPARTGNDITGNDGGTSTATGGIQIDNVSATREYDKPSVGSAVKLHVDYSGKNVAQGATFSVTLGEGLKIPAGLTKVPLKATTLDGSREEAIGECNVTDSGINCEITADIAATLGGNGDLKAAYVNLSVAVDSSAVGKKSVDITVAGTTYTVSMGDGVIGEGYDKNPGKSMYSDGMENGLHRHRGWLWTGELPGGTAVTITDNGADVLASKAYCTANGSWAKQDEILADNNKLSADKHTITFTTPAAGDKVNCRVAFKNLTEGLFLHNEATINGVTFIAENTWRAKGGSGGSTDEDAKPVPPEPTPTPDPTPDPTPEPSEPPAPTPEPSEPPAPTPEPSDPPVPTPAPTPDTPKPDPKPTPEQPTPDPKPTPDTPPVTPDPEPSVPPVSPDPKPSTPPVTPTPDPSEPPATPEPKPSEPTTPVTPNTPSTPDTPPVTPKAPTPSAPANNGGSTLAKTGADAGLIAGAGALAVAGGALLVARRRQNKN